MTPSECEQEYCESGDTLYEAYLTDACTDDVTIIGRINVKDGCFFSEDAIRLMIDPESVDWFKW